MSRIELKDVSMVYPFQEVSGLFGRRKKEEILKTKSHALHLQRRCRGFAALLRCLS